MLLSGHANIVSGELITLLNLSKYSALGPGIITRQRLARLCVIADGIPRSWDSVYGGVLLYYSILTCIVGLLQIDSRVEWLELIFRPVRASCVPKIHQTVECQLGLLRGSPLLPSA